MIGTQNRDLPARKRDHLTRERRRRDDREKKRGVLLHRNFTSS